MHFKEQRRLSATFALGRHHVGLEGDVSALALQLNHTQVAIVHRYAAERAIDMLAALDKAVQEDGVVVGVVQWETTHSFAIVDVGHGGLKKELPQGHGQALKTTLSGR